MSWKLPSAVSERAGYRVQVIDRAVAVLDVLVMAGVELGPSEIAARLDLHKSTVHRLLAVLETHQLVMRLDCDGKYGLGARFFEMARRSAEQVRMRAVALPILRGVVDEVEETVHVAIREGPEMVSIIKADAPWKLRLPSALGRRTPLYCTAIGKCAVADLPVREIDPILSTQTFTRLTRQTFVSPAAFRDELRRVHERGYAIDDEEFQRGVRCVSAPIRDEQDQVVAAVSVVGPSVRVTRERLSALTCSMKETARDLSIAIARKDAPQVAPASLGRKPG